MSASLFWWIVEVGLVAVAVFAGVAVLLYAALLTVLDAPRAETIGAFLLGLALWGGGILWGMFINGGGARWLLDLTKAA